jgi:5-methylcytosine-specific restriction endonuclease McrA
MKDWHSEVYKPGVKKEKRWLSVRGRCFLRDDNMCQMCRKKSNLTAHHLKPREEGGKSQLRNLITLCEKCHNIAEMECLNRTQIIKFYKGYGQIVKTALKCPSPRPDWHSWVYGGYKRP